PTLAGLDGQSGKLIVDGPGKSRGQAVTDHDERGEATEFSRFKSYRVVGISGDHIVHIGAEGEDLHFPSARSPHFHGDKRHPLDLDRHLLEWSDEVIASVVLKAEHRGKQLDERQSLDGAALVVPGPVAPYFEPDTPAKINVWQCSGTRFAAKLFQCYEN